MKTKLPHFGLLIFYLFCLLTLASALACRLTSDVPGEPNLPTNSGTYTTEPPRAALASNIPDEYQTLADDIAIGLSTFEKSLASRWDGTRSETIYSSDLSYATGNIGDALLDRESLDRVRLQLDAFQKLGIGGVELQVADPLLYPSFPRSQDYLTFYKQVVEEIHQRKMKVLIETGPVFAGTIYSPVRWSWSSFDTEQYFQARQEQLVLIASEIRPDYLSIGNEVSTEEMLTGLTFAKTDYLDYIRGSAAMIGNLSDVYIGSGTGTWEDPSYLDSMLLIESLDFINLHIYPIGKEGRLLQHAYEVALKASQSGKQVVIGEAWLYKVSPQELSAGIGSDFTEIYRRDIYSFWSPLDVRFIEDVMDLSDAAGIDFVSFFWGRYLFSYLDFDSIPKNMSSLQLNQLENQAARSNMESGMLSYTGQAYQKALNDRP